MVNKPRLILFGAIIILESVFLTFILDVFALNTKLKCLYIFGYFCIMGALLYWLRSRFIPKGNKRTRLIAGILAAVLLAGFQGFFLPVQQESLITLSAVGENGERPQKEVWLSAIEMDGKRVPLADVAVENNAQWTFISQYGSYAFYPAEGVHENWLTLRVLAKEVKLQLECNGWSGEVEIQDSAGGISRLNLTSDEAATVLHEVHVARAYAIWQRILLNMGALVVLYFILEALIAKVYKVDQGGKDNQPLNRIMVWSACFISYGLLFFTHEKISPDAGTLFVLLGLTCTGAEILFRRCVFRIEKSDVYLLLCAVYASFASWGQRFFMDGNTRTQVSIEGILYLLLGVVWFFPVLNSLLFGMEYLAKACSVRKERNLTLEHGSRSFAYLKLFGVLMAVQLVLFAGFYPGFFSSDAMDQLNQAYGNAALNDWHPVFHTLCMRAIITVIDNPAVITLVQMAALAGIVSAILMLGDARGISLKLLCVIGVVFLLLPNQVVSSTDVQKDFPFTLFLAGGGYLLYLLMKESGIVRKKWFILCLTLDLFGILVFRHNGLIPFVFVAAFCIAYTGRHLRIIGKGLIYAVVTSIAAFGILKGPVCQALSVAPNGTSIYTTMMCAVASCLNKDLPLSEEANRIMDNAMPVEDWATYYDRFRGHDPYLWGRGADAKPYDLSGIDAKKAFGAYFEALLTYPDVVIKDRLDGANIMWDVNQPEDGFTYKGNMGIHNFPYTKDYFDTEKLKLDGDRYYSGSSLQQKYMEEFNRSDSTLQFVLLWRTGAYLIFFGILLVYWYKHHMMWMLVPALPMIGNIAGLMLVLFHQSFRYVYFIQIFVLMLAFMTITYKEDTEDE